MMITTTTMMMIWAVLGVAAGTFIAFPTALGEGGAVRRYDARPPPHKESLIDPRTLYGSDVDEAVVVGHAGGNGDDDGGRVVRGREATRGEETSTFDEDGGRGGGGTFRNLPSAVPPFVPARAFEVRRKRQAAGKTVNAENARSPTPPEPAPPSPSPPSAAATTAAEDVNAKAEQADATSIPHSPRPALADNGTEVDTEVDLSSPGQSSSSSSSDNITEASDHSPKVITPKTKSASGRAERIPRARNPFKPVTSETYGAYAILGFSLLLFAVGLASNLTVICVVCNNRYMKNVSNSLLANMAFWDFLVIFVCLPLTAVHELSKRWVLGDFTCKLVPYLEVASLGITTFTLAALCLDRFHAATNVRLHYEQTEGCISRGGKLAVVWLGALVLSTPELLIHGLAGRDSVSNNNNHHHYQDHQNTQQQGVAVAGGASNAAAGAGSTLPYDRCEMRVPHELPDFLYMLSATYRAARPWWFFGCYFCLPIAFTVTCSVLTARRMKGAGAAAHNKPSPGEAGPATSLTRGSTRQQLRLERQMNCAVVALATAYACCLVPEIVCSMVWEYAGVGGGQSPALDVLHTVAQYLLFSKSCLSPVLLLGLCRELARAARACCCCCCPCPETGGGEGSAEAPSSPAPPGGGAVVALSPCVATVASDENENERPAGEMELFTFSTVQRELTTFSTA
ncbi:prosaposin receptor GPR37 [Petromyzon marinus]|uniref:Prosaposin receptor GPR37 n=1 Tax=Petromyzon marinus TaxID=7757 RepID=A0AAJ7T2S6_PETMA|nr:prosaposin receptor GPR37 [Petromyzon marinus]